MTELPSAADVRSAGLRLAGQIQNTPFLHSTTLSAIAGCEIWIKFENLQFTASFKERGALNALSLLTPAQRSRGVIAMSAGNHAQGLAYHAQRLKLAATIVMPAATPFTKVEHTRRHGAEVRLVGEDLAAARDEAQRLARESGAVLVHPYDDPAVIAGQGTVGLEILATGVELDDLVVPIGGGGLISGIGLIAKDERPRLRLIGVQVQAYPAMFAAIHHQELPFASETIAEGIAVKFPGELTRRLVSQLVDEVLLVNEAAVEEAIALFINVEKTVAEGAGAVPLAAVLSSPATFVGRRVGLVLSGGNIDSRLIAQVLLRDLVREGRIVEIRVATSDRPGALAKITGLVAEGGGNILEVVHQPLFSTSSAKATNIDLTIECRSADQSRRLVERLQNSGFPVSLMGGSLAGPTAPATRPT